MLLFETYPFPYMVIGIQLFFLREAGAPASHAGGLCLAAPCVTSES